LAQIEIFGYKNLVIYTDPTFELRIDFCFIANLVYFCLNHNIPVPGAEKQFLGLRILKFFNADPGCGIFLTLDQRSGWKNSDPG
jgi:hypothetical protein